MTMKCKCMLIHCCAHWCALCQEAREIQHWVGLQPAEYHDGLNAPLVTQINTMAPGVQESGATSPQYEGFTVDVDGGTPVDTSHGSGTHLQERTTSPVGVSRPTSPP